MLMRICHSKYVRGSGGRYFYTQYIPIENRYISVVLTEKCCQYHIQGVETVKIQSVILRYKKNGATSNDVAPFKAQSNESVP